MLSHFHLHQGKRRCLTRHLTHEQYKQLKEVHQPSRDARLKSVTGLPNWIPDDQLVSIGVVMHFITTDRSKTLHRHGIPILQEILKVLRSGYENKFCTVQDLERIENGPFLQQSKHHRELYRAYTARAASPQVTFLLALPPKIHYLHRVPDLEKGSDSDHMDTWDEILKKQIAPAIEPHRLYNIWVVDNISSILLGYGNFPKVHPSKEDLRMDGFVYFLSPPPYHLHITSIHESGHWFGLHHAFRSDPIKHTFDDDVEDTPYQDRPDYGSIWDKEGSWPYSIKDGLRHYHGLPNLMGYLNDDSMFMFTHGQCKKIRDAINTVRRPWVLTESQSTWLKNGSPYPLSKRHSEHFHNDTTDDDDEGDKTDRERKGIMEKKTLDIQNPILDTDPFMYRMSKKPLKLPSTLLEEAKEAQNQPNRFRREGKIADFVHDLSGMCTQSFHKLRAVSVVSTAAVEMCLPS